MCLFLLYLNDDCVVYNVTVSYFLSPEELHCPIGFPHWQFQVLSKLLWISYRKGFMGKFFHLLLLSGNWVYCFQFNHCPLHCLTDKLVYENIAHLYDWKSNQLHGSSHYHLRDLLLIITNRNPSIGAFACVSYFGEVLPTTQCTLNRACCVFLHSLLTIATFEIPSYSLVIQGLWFL